LDEKVTLFLGAGMKWVQINHGLGSVLWTGVKKGIVKNGRRPVKGDERKSVGIRFVCANI